MEIRLATIEDIDKIGALYVNNHRKTYRNLLSDEYINGLTTEYGVQKWGTYLAAGENRIWVAYEEETFLGFVAGTIDAELENTWYLDSLHVTEESRGKGVGTTLIKTIGQYALEQGYQVMSICIVKGNDNAGNLYQKLGARPWKDFEDDFCGTISQSQKLLWENLDIFKER